MENEIARTENEKSIDAITKLIDCSEKLILDTLEAAKDGLGFDDISVVTSNVSTIKDLIDSIKNVGDEASDINMQEAQQLAARAVSLTFNVLNKVNELRAARKNAGKEDARV